MEILYIILLLAVLGITLYSIISYFCSRGSLKKKHREAMQSLEPIRHLNSEERDAFEKLYKKPVSGQGSVYQVEGPLEYIGLSYQGSESKEFAVGGIRLDRRSVARLGKKDIQLNIETIADQVNENKLEEKLVAIKISGREKGASDEEIGREITQALKDELSHSAEFVFLSENIMKKPAFLVAFDKWKLSDSEKQPD